jgi:Rieske Fe-S protein
VGFRPALLLFQKKGEFMTAKSTAPEEMKLINPFEQNGQWYKANLHTHTTLSDGGETPAQRVQRYKEKGYAVLALTDHGKTNDVTGLTAKDFLVISGMETHPLCPLPGIEYHLVCLNVPHGFTIPEDADAATRIAMVKKAGGEFIYAHPYWCGHTINHILMTKGFIGIEVYNATCTKIGKGFSSVQWDDLLALGMVTPAVAVDDCHGGRDMFMGWTMIKARDLALGSIMAALKSGCYYASCGPTIEDFRLQDGKFFVHCSPAAEIHLMCNGYYGRSLYADEGPDLTYSEMPASPEIQYLRAEVVDRQGRRAWTNPLFFKK